MDYSRVGKCANVKLLVRGRGRATGQKATLMVRNVRTT